MVWHLPELAHSLGPAYDEQRIPKDHALASVATLMNELLTLLEKPAGPVANQGDWEAAEAELKTALPEDFKWFIGQYGSGQMGDMYICSPLATKPGYKLCEYHDSVIRAYQDLSADGGDEIPYPMFPDVGGLLSWGSTGNGDYLHWLTKGDPADWTIVALAFGEVEFLEYDGNFVEFLVDVLTGRLTWAMFPRVFYDSPCAFHAG